MASPTTTLGLGTQDPVVGEPVVVDVQVAAPYEASGDPSPTGSVTVSDGTRTCHANLSGSGGTATGSCEITETAVGTYRFTASYPGDANFVSSSTVGPLVVSVGKAASTTQLELSKSTATYGHEKSLVFTVTVRPQFTGSPTGDVTITVGGSTEVCKLVLAGGTGKCSTTNPDLVKPGKRTLKASYPGTVRFGPSSATKVLTVESAT